MSEATTQKTRGGPAKAARRLAERTGRPVTPDDVQALVEAGALAVDSTWRGYDLFDLDALDDVDADQVAAVLASPDRLLNREQAAAHLRVRAVDFKHLVTAGVITADSTATVALPHLSSRAATEVDLFRLAQLEEVTARAELAELWEAARAAAPRSPSPFRRLAGVRKPSRADAVRQAAQELADLWSVEVWTAREPGISGGRWLITADTSADTLTEAEAREGFAQHRLLAEHVAAGSVVAQRATEMSVVVASRRYMRPGQAVILDTETTGLDGYLVEVAVIDAATGETLLDTLVQPGAEVEDGAREVHGITDADLADAPTFAEVLPDLAAAVGDRVVLAYNADFDRTVLRRHAKRDGLRLGELARAERWDCLMEWYTDWLGEDRWVPLGGGHRALGDCRAARKILQKMTSQYDWINPDDRLWFRTYRPRTLADAVEEPTP
ncbi:3'-5' exonuclease [Antribacter gilvus]|uniref:3'-5' exonuclease n=1 Tax=Antribacter gilvus TaxID=2304675 RepID=UPI000F7A4FCA|nr:3'-5' exonuclease [Antribacter gilvus]